ncbi:hypothetical protein ACFL6S_28265, partial [Candidatus Poribacteria bacterium]
ISDTEVTRKTLDQIKVLAEHFESWESRTHVLTSVALVYAKIGDPARASRIVKDIIHSVEYNHSVSEQIASLVGRTLIQADEDKYVLDMVKNIADSKICNATIPVLSEILVNKGDYISALALIELVRDDDVQGDTDGSKIWSTLISVVTHLVSTSEGPDRDVLLSRALRLVDRFASDCYQLTEIAGVLAQGRYKEKARMLFSKSVKIVDKTGEHRGEQLSAIAKALAKTGVKHWFAELIDTALEYAADWDNVLTEFIVLYDDVDALCGAAVELGLDIGELASKSGGGMKSADAPGS